MLCTIRTCTLKPRGSCLCRLCLRCLDNLFYRSNFEGVIIDKTVPTIMSSRLDELLFELILKSARGNLLLDLPLVFAIVRRLKLPTVFNRRSWQGSLATLRDKNPAVFRIWRIHTFVSVSLSLYIVDLVGIEVVKKEVVLLILSADNGLDWCCINVVFLEGIIWLHFFNYCLLILIEVLENWSLY